MATSPLYRVQLYDATGSNFAPGSLVAEFTDAVNIGYAEYMNDVAESFFTISQDDPKISLLRSHRNKAHIKILRNNDLVWGGILGEWSADQRDAIFYGYGYAALFHLILSEWNVAYTNVQVDTLVNDAFTRAKTGLTSTLSGWLTSGTVEAPVTTSGGGTAIVLPSYRMFYKRTLRLFQELAALSIGETTNVVYFEVTPSGTFNFWKNRGDDLDFKLRFPGNVLAFDEGNIPILRRNNLFGVGINPNDVTLRQEVSSSADITANGRRMEPIFYPWVRDSTELLSVQNTRLARAKRDVVDLGVTLKQGVVTPPRATGATFKLGDRLATNIVRGVTNVTTSQMVSGYQTLYVRGTERTRVILQERPGT